MLSAMKGSAHFSRCGQYRYQLSRCWDPTMSRCTFIGLNPSTADANTNDPTIRRVISFAQEEGFGGVIVCNLFAFRATRPEDLKASIDPVGPRNNFWIRRSIAESDLTVVAWGNHGTFNNRAARVLRYLTGPMCLGTTSLGQPKHPLYLAKTTSLRPYP